MKLKLLKNKLRITLLGYIVISQINVKEKISFKK